MIPLSMPKFIIIKIYEQVEFVLMPKNLGAISNICYE